MPAKVKEVIIQEYRREAYPAGIDIIDQIVTKTQWRDLEGINDRGGEE